MKKGLKFADVLLPLALDGSKTQTRRLMEEQPEMVTDTGIEPWVGNPLALIDLLRRAHRGPRYQPGDIVPLQDKHGVTKGYGRILDVRAERVQDISEEDAIAEGISEHATIKGWHVGPGGLRGTGTAKDLFALLWDSIAKPGFRWADNPWNRAYTFELCGRDG